jgi:hypothetical protein
MVESNGYNKNNYRELLTTAIKHGYKFKNYFTFNDHTEDREIILRHDVDMSPFMALEIARIEKELSVKATYAILSDAISYNVLSEEIIAIINEIHGLGHEIALHYGVPEDFDENSRQIEERITKDIMRRYQILKTIYPYLANVFVWHNFIEGISLSKYAAFQVGSLFNSHSLKHFRYISDSNMRYSYNELIDFVNGEIPKIHLLLHPLNWVPEAGTAIGNLKEVFAELIIRRFKSLLRNRVWKEYYGKRMGGATSLESILNLLRD